MIPTSFQTNLTDTWAHASKPKDALGTVRYQNGKWYKCVQYTTGAGAVAAVAGNVCYYTKDDAAGEGYATHRVTSDLSDSYNVGAGVLLAAPADEEACWIQLTGYAVLTTALTAGLDGNALTPVGATDGTLDVSALVTDHICAIAVDASAKKVLCMFPF